MAREKLYTKSLRLRVHPTADTRVRRRAKKQRKPIVDVLRDAVDFYMDHLDKQDDRAKAATN